MNNLFRLSALALALSGGVILAQAGSASSSSIPGTGRESTTVQGTTLAEVPRTPEAKVTGLIDLKPSYVPSKSEGRTENTLELGYKFNSNIAIAAHQDFHTPLANSYREALVLKDSYLKAKFSNLWADASRGLSLSYEPRVYLPLAAAKSSAGMITTVRNIVTLSKRFSPVYSLSVSEVPMLHVYNRAGTTTTNADGSSTATANPVFENRIIVNANFTFGKWTLGVPLMLHTTRYANYQPGANLNDQWDNFIWVYPELMYALTTNASLGLSYYSDNLLNYDTAGFYNGAQVGQGLRQGVYQMVLRATL